jgi:hypothetical protein
VENSYIKGTGTTALLFHASYQPSYSSISNFYYYNIDITGTTGTNIDIGATITGTFPHWGYYFTNPLARNRGLRDEDIGYPDMGITFGGKYQ